MSKSGFTLIELSIVLVIIGLIVGGVLVGQDLIRAAAVRAQISQIEKYQTAVNTFYGKYGYLAGDLNQAAASQFGFASRGTLPGEGDGNGILEGVYSYSSPPDCGANEVQGETVMFWADLTTANGLNLNLIDGSFGANSSTTVDTGASYPASLYFPSAKIGKGNYMFVYSGGPGLGSDCTSSDGHNYFGLFLPTYIGSGYEMNSAPGLTVVEAYNIDIKMDDGLPQSGNVTATFIYWYNGWPHSSSNSVIWAAGVQTGGASSGYEGGGGPTTAATPGSSTTCYDNGGVNGAIQQYSMGQNNGAGVNCALSFKFQ